MGRRVTPLRAILACMALGLVLLVPCGCCCPEKPLDYYGHAMPEDFPSDASCGAG